MKKIIFSAALLMGFATMSFAGNPKVETKDNPSATKTEAKAGTDLVWYKVVYDASHTMGYIPANAQPIFEGDQSGAEALGECPSGNAKDCLRGFADEPTLPSNDQGDQQVKRN